MASSLARRLAEAAIAELRASSLPVASSAPSLAVALLAAPSASSIHVSAARTTSPNAFFSVTFPAASAARSALGAKMSCTPPEAAPSAISIVSAAPPTSPTTFPAAPAASSALGAKMSCTSPEAAPSVISIFASAAPPTSPTNFHASTSPAASAASSALGSSPTPAPFRSLAAIGSGAEDDRCESGSVLVRFPSAIRNDRRNDRRYTIWLPPAIRNDRRYYSNWASTSWEQTTPKETPPSPQVPLGSRPFTSQATPTPHSELSPRSVLYLIDLLDGMVLSTNEELMFRKAFNEKFPRFKVADMLNHLETEDFTIEEWCFMLKIIHSKLGQNKGLVELLLQEDTNLSSTNHEITRNLVLARVETKIDILTEKVDKGHSDILKCVRVSNKGEWGTIEVFGKKLDLTKLEFVRKLIGIVTGV